MKFIHISDTHFGKIYKNIDMKTAKLLIAERKRRFTYVVEYAIENDFEFIIHSGDLFDTKEPDYIDIRFIRKCLKRLLEHNINFYFIRGNHDKKDGILFDDLINVYEFSSDEVTKYEKQDYVIHGISQFDDDIRNPATLLNRVDGKINIAILHSNVQNTNHKNYMPTTLKELKNLNFDYIALGHIHIPTVLADNIIYAGSLCPVSKKDIGARGFYEVEIINKAVARFVEIEGLIFSKYVLDIKSVYDIEDFISYQNKNQIIELVVNGYVDSNELSNVKRFLHEIVSSGLFVGFSYVLNVKCKDNINHPMYGTLISNLKTSKFLDFYESEYIDDYDAKKDISENFDEIVDIIDDLFRR